MVHTRQWEGLTVATPAEALAARRIAAACWNAALDAVVEAEDAMLLTDEHAIRLARLRAATAPRPIKFEGEMQKFSQ